ncbi:hypothetical protein cypCar_00014302 [Cyprinus carpio]|nr:hypothetical protein cypCar_00014302 [Cyprinus carpio]
MSWLRGYGSVNRDKPVVSKKMCLPSVMVLPLLIVVFAGVYYVYSEVKRFMSESMVRNKVVVITDAVSEMGNAASKHAVQAFSECLRAEVEEYGISVSTISHTFINTPSQTPPSIPLWA